MNHVVDAGRYEKGQLLGLSGQSGPVFAAEGIIQVSITAPHAMRPFVKILSLITCLYVNSV